MELHINFTINPVYNSVLSEDCCLRYLAHLNKNAVLGVSNQVEFSLPNWKKELIEDLFIIFNSESRGMVLLNNLSDIYSLGKLKLVGTITQSTLIMFKFE